MVPQMKWYNRWHILMYPQCYRQLLYWAPPCITLKIRIWVVAYFFNFFQLFQKKLYIKAILCNFSMRLLKLPILLSKKTTKREEVFKNRRFWDDIVYGRPLSQIFTLEYWSTKWFSFIIHVGWASAHTGFGRSVNPISTKGGSFCPPHCYMLTQF